MSDMDQSLMARYLESPSQESNDNTWYGDEITGPKDSNISRLMFHNVNGLSLYSTEGLDMFTNEQYLLEVDIQGISEHCLDTTKYEFYQTAKEIVRRNTSVQSLLTLHSTDEPAVNLYKPGGTGFLVLGDTVSRLEPNGLSGDSMGRWSTIHFRRHDQPPVSIITTTSLCS